MQQEKHKKMTIETVTIATIDSILNPDESESTFQDIKIPE